MSAEADPASIPDRKRHLRRRMRALRLVADQKQGPEAAVAVMHAFLGCLADVGVVPGRRVSGYWPIDTELDDRPLLARLHERGIICALPVMVAPDRPLVFRRWTPDDMVSLDTRGLHEPGPEAPEVVPEVLLVPFLAADRRGYRLGQGGGHFDRTLAALRSRGSIATVGVGFAVQVIDDVPHDGHDQRLDWLLTDEGLTGIAV